MTTTQAHTLYRFYDATGTLLYVGITLDPGSRWRSHAQDKPWWHDVAEIRLELFPSRPTVLDAERAAIIAEHPRHNVIHNRRSIQPALPLTQDNPEDFDTYWARISAEMPDDCQTCARAGILSLYFPHLWYGGTAHYTCTHGHHWTCGWGNQHVGGCDANRGTFQQRYQGSRAGQ